jgi:cell wall-associated NlpC family hydrolase
MNIETYLTVPYVDGSRDIANGLDCWGMARHVLHYEFSLPLLESFGGVDRKMRTLMTDGFEKSAPDFKECLQKAGAVACCFYRGNNMDIFHHVGVCINDRDVLHTSSKKGPHVSSIRAFKRLSYVVKFYEYVGRK